MKTKLTLCSLALMLMLSTMSEKAAAGLITFQNGLNNYNGQSDLAIRSSGGLWDDGRLLVDSSPRVQSLVIFSDMFGDQNTQIPYGASIISAVLSLQTANSFPSSYSGTVNTIDIYRMDSSWNSDTRWSDLSTLNDSIGLKNKATFISSLEGGVENWAVASFDVTQAVQGWSDGTVTNFGFGIVNEHSDGADFWNGVHSVVSERPRLTVSYQVVPEPATITLVSIGAIGLLFRSRRKS